MARGMIGYIATVAVLVAIFSAEPSQAATPVHHDGDPISIARAFAGRIASAMEGGPVPMDQLFAPAIRDSAIRMLDARSNALFSWSGVRVELDSSRVRRVVTSSPSSGPQSPIDLVVRVSGMATWDPQAYAVATSLWRPLHDESRETNRISRREAWRIESTPVGWRATERVALSPFHVRDLKIRAGVFPEQDVLLVESTFSLVCGTEGLESARFFLDRRAEIYDLSVNDHPAEVIRGSELGSLGLEGFSPEVESSFRLPRALAHGDEVLVKFRTRSPLVHLRGPGFITTLPLGEGSFRERAWIPVFGPELEEESRDGEVELIVAWPKGAFEGVLLPGQPARENAGRWPEEDAAMSRCSRARSVDFVLLVHAGNSEDVFDVLRGVRGGDPRLVEGTGIHWQDGEESWEPFAPAAAPFLDPHPRARRALVLPLAEISMASSRDLSSELQDALPLDADMLDELFDDSATDAERSADDRSAE